MIFCNFLIINDRQSLLNLYLQVLKIHINCPIILLFIVAIILVTVDFFNIKKLSTVTKINYNLLFILIFVFSSSYIVIDIKSKTMCVKVK